jgi:hypothetical protein
MMPQQGNMTINTSWSNNINFLGYVNNDNIYTSNGELIGVNLKKYQEIEQGLITCKNRLIELGEIEAEKTPEEIIKEQSEMLKQQRQALNEMMVSFQQLKERLNEHSIYSKNSSVYSREHQEQCYNGNQQDVSDTESVTNKNASGCTKGDTVAKKSRITV